MIRNVYLDTEFIPAVPTTGGLISIGLTDNHGRDYYAVNADINPPDNGGEHHALADAKYNRQFHEFLTEARMTKEQQ